MEMNQVIGNWEALAIVRANNTQPEALMTFSSSQKEEFSIRRQSLMSSGNQAVL